MEDLEEGYKNTEIGVIPEDWGVKTISETFDFLKTHSNSRNDLSDKGDIYYIHYGDIHTKFNFFIDLKTAKLPSVNINKLKNPVEFIKNGDLIVADVSEDYKDIGKSVEIKNLENKKAVAGLHTFLLRDKNNNFIDGYKGYLLLNENVSKEIKKIATGISVLGISKTNFKKIKIPLPPLNEQKEIAEILSTIDQKIEKEENRKKALNELFNSMLNNLMTGKIRVNTLNFK